MLKILSQVYEITTMLINNCG